MNEKMKKIKKNIREKSSIWWRDNVVKLGFGNRGT